MKVTKEEFDAMWEAIVPLNTRERRDAYRRRAFPRSAMVQDIDMRYRWDLFWIARNVGNDLLHPDSDYTTAHIDTALRRIVPLLGDYECPLCNSIATYCTEVHTDNEDGPRLHCTSASMHNFRMIDGDWQLV